MLSVITPLLVLNLNASAHASTSTDFRLMTEENPPFNYTDQKSGKFVGIGTEMVEEIFNRAGYRYAIVSAPWLRTYNSAMNERQTCAFMTARTEERDPLFKWVGPFMRVEWVVYGLNSGVTASSVEDLKNLRVGGYNGDGPSVLLQSKGIKLDLVTSDELNPKKLQTGRIDAWVTNSVRGPLLAKKQGLRNLRKLFALKVINHFVACNKGIDDADIQSLNRQLQSLRTRGGFDSIVRKYARKGVP